MDTFQDAKTHEPSASNFLETKSDISFEEKVDNLYGLLANELNAMARNIDSITTQIRSSNNVALSFESHYCGLLSIMHNLTSSTQDNLSHQSNNQHTSDKNSSDNQDSEREQNPINGVSTYILTSNQDKANQTSPSKS